MKKNIRQVIRGDYVATPVKNAFNNKTSYWLSKRGYTISMYMFTVEGNGDSAKDFEWKLSEDGFRQYIPMLEERLKYPCLWTVSDDQLKAELLKRDANRHTPL